MYGPAEHREALNRICVITANIEADRELIAAMRVDLFGDAASRTSDAREHLRAASLLLERAEKACKEAIAALPTPAARPDYPAAYDALHEGHR